MTSATMSKRQRRMARQPQSDANAPQGQDHAASPARGSRESKRAKSPGKTEAVVALLKREGGATLDELIEVTAWLPHSARAAVTGLKKNGHAIQRSKVDGISRYKIVEPVSQ